MNRIGKGSQETAKIFLLTALWITVFWLYCWWGVNFFVSEEHRGSFGDKFGAVNSLFSGLAFACLIITIFLQGAELRLQREELAETRQVLSRQAEELSEQNKTLLRQRFESTFFSLISLHDENVGRLVAVLPHMSKGAQGRRVFKGIITCYNSDVSKKSRDLEGDTLDNLMRISIFKTVIGHLRSGLSQYFKSIQTILALLESLEKQNVISARDIGLYAEIFKSQLSDQEVQVLFYYGLSCGDSKMKKLLENFSILSGVRDVDRELMQYYDSKAYSENQT